VKLRTYLIVLFVVGGLFYAPAISAYEPSNSIKMIAFSDLEAGETLNPGKLVNVTFVLKNFTNETMNAINVTHILLGDIQVVSAPAGILANKSASLNVTSPFTYETPTNGSVQISRAFVNSSYYELSFDRLLPSQSMSWIVTFNSSEIKTYEISPPVIRYPDKWTDVQRFDSGNHIQLKYERPSEADPSQKNYPLFETGQTNWTIIISAMLLVAFLAIFSKVLYGKKPF